MSVQPVADRYEGTTIDTTDVGFTFARGETEAGKHENLHAARWIPAWNEFL